MPISPCATIIIMMVVDGWCMDGCMGGCMGGWMDAWMDGIMGDVARARRAHVHASLRIHDNACVDKLCM
jgi:hypothetical protein